MTTSESKILADVLDLMTELAGDWEYSDPITLETQLLGDLGMESLALVVLGASIQDRYGTLPFAEFLTEIGRRPPEQRDVSVGELVAFVCQHANGVAIGEKA